MTDSGAYDLGGAVLRLYGDRSALDRELEVLRRYTAQLEKQGIRVKFDADTGTATREVDLLQNRLTQCQDVLRQLQGGLQGDGNAWAGLADKVGMASAAMKAGGGAAGDLIGSLGGAAAAGLKFIPVLGQIGMAAMGLKAIWDGLTATINGVIAPMERFAAQAGRFNKQVAEASIFTAQAFAVLGPNGEQIEGTANQMRALRGTITAEFREIQKEVAQISGATSSEIYEGMNIILQNASGLGEKGQNISNLRELAIKSAAAMNTLNIPGFQLRSEMQSLLTGNVQVYDQLAMKLYGQGAGEKIRKLQEEGKYYEDLMKKLQKLYDGQKVLAGSLSNVKSNFDDVFERINSEGGAAFERGLAAAFQRVLSTLDTLQGSLAGFLRSIGEGLEPLLKPLGQLGSMLVSIGSVLTSVGSIAFDVLNPVLTLVGMAADLNLGFFAQTLELIAKTLELVARAAAAGARPLTVFLRLLGDRNVSTSNSFFDDLITKLEAASDRITKLQQQMANFALPVADRLIALQEFVAGRVRGRSDSDIAQRTKTAQATFRAEFQNQLGSADPAPLVSTALNPKSRQLLDELNQRYGSGSQRQLQIAKEVSKLREDTLRNEITGLERGLQLMQAQKSVAEALSGLADARRGLAMKQVEFLAQLATSPEARTLANDRRDELAAQQEQERLRERGQLLRTEREILQQQLQIQLRQAQIQQEGLKIQQAELLIARDKASAAARDASAKLRGDPQRGIRAINPDSEQGRALAANLQQFNREVDLRNQQLDVIRRQVGYAFQLEGQTRALNGLEAQRLGIQGEQLAVQGQGVQLTLEQQRILSALAKEEQAIRNVGQQRLQDLQGQIAPLQQQQKALEQQQKAAAQSEKIEKARTDLAKARAESLVKGAERELAVANAQNRARQSGSVRDWMEASLMGLAAGTRGYVQVAEATRKLNAARERQLQLEQEAQQRQLKIQQDRERSELRIQQLQVQVLLLQSRVAEQRLEVEQKLLGLNQRRDAMSGMLQSPAIGAGAVVGYTGGAVSQPALTRGRSTGPHLHAQGGPNAATLRQWVDAALAFEGGMTASQMSRKVGGGLGRGDHGPGGHGYSGQDYYMNQGTPFSLRPGWSARNLGPRGALGLGMEVSGPNGERFQLGHLERVVSSSVNAATRAMAGPGRGAGAGSLTPKQASNLDRFLNYLASIESGFDNGAQNRTSGAIGRFQFTGPTLQDARNRYGINPADIRSSDFARQKRAVAEFIRQDDPMAFQALLGGDFATAEGRLGRRWSSLRGAGEAASGERLATGLQYLNGKAAPVPGSLAAAGGIAPTSSVLQGQQIASDLAAQKSNSEQQVELLEQIRDLFKQSEERFQLEQGALAQQQENTRLTQSYEARLAELQAQFNNDPRIQSALSTGEALSGGVMGAAKAGGRALLSGDTEGLKAEIGQILTSTAQQLLDTAIQGLLQPLLQQMGAGLLQLFNPGLMGQMAAAHALDASAAQLNAAAMGLTYAGQSIAGIQAANQAIAGAGGGLGSLLGIASKAFGAIGGINWGGGFGVGGVPDLPGLSGLGALNFRAAGGPTSPNSTYVIGEKGPELFQPQTLGRVIPNNQMSGMGTPYAAATSYIQSSESQIRLAALSREPIKVETTTINSVEYATVEQLQTATSRAEERGAERGRSMTLSALQNSVKTRKRVGF